MFYSKHFVTTMSPYEFVEPTIYHWHSASADINACRYTMPIVFITTMITVSTVIFSTFCGIIAFSGILSSRSKIAIVARNISMLMSVLSLVWSLGAVVLFRVGPNSCYQDLIRSFVFSNVKLGHGFM